MKKAVLCIAHKEPQQLNVLVRQILADSPESDIYFHIDKKADAIKKEIMEHPQVHFVNSHSITWGDDSCVRMLVDVFGEIVGYGKEYDYFQIVTGQDLLVRPGLDKFLEENRGSIFIDMHKDDRHIKNVLRHKYPKSFCKDHSNSFMFYVVLAYTLMTRMWLIPKKKIRYDIKKLDFICSFNWSIMPYEVLVYIHNFLKENPGFLDMYWDTMNPEDGFLGTILINSPYRDNIVWREELDREIMARGPVRRAESQMFMKKFIGPHPPFLTMEDIPAIEASGLYMARKFDISKNPDVVAYYENLIVNNKEGDSVQ